MSFSPEELERYTRQLILKDVGAKGQRKIKDGKVLVIGAGGLGSTAIMYLAAAGVGTLGIADADCVDLTNLQRQIIHTTDDLGVPKVESAAATVKALNPNVEVVTYKEYVTAENIKEIIEPYDFIIDATDNFPAKYLINDACVLFEKPFSHAGILRFEGQMTTYLPGEGPCFRCMFPVPPPPELSPTCKEAGIIGAVPGVVGSLQAVEAIKFLTGAGDLLVGKLLIIDLLTMEFHTVNMPREDSCPVCGKEPVITSLVEYEQTVCDLKDILENE